MKKEIIKTDKAPLAVGAYSQGVKIGSLIFCAGQIAIDPKTNKFLDLSIEEQTKCVCGNIKGILEKAGSSLLNVVKTTIFLDDLNDFQIVNKIYSEYFNKSMPARSCVEVAELPLGAKIEIEAIAFVD